MSRTGEEILTPLSLQDLSELCDRLGAPVGGVLTPIGEAAARRVFLAALNMLGEWARQAADLPPIGFVATAASVRQGPTSTWSPGLGVILGCSGTSRPVRNSDPDRLHAPV